jgi:hypothetical protein
MCLVVVLKIGWDGSQNVLVNLLVIATAAFLFSMLYGTYYQLKDGIFLYRSGPIAGKIMVSDIREVHVGVTTYFGFRPALALKGLVIRYFKFDDIYISPETNQRFVDELLKINPEIKVHR